MYGHDDHLEVLIEEVEEQHDGKQRGQGQGHNDANEDNGREKLQHAAQEEGCKIRQILVSVHSVLSQAINDAAQWRCVEEGHGCPATLALCQNTHQHSPPTLDMMHCDVLCCPAVSISLGILITIPITHPCV